MEERVYFCSHDHAKVCISYFSVDVMKRSDQKQFKEGEVYLSLWFQGH